MVIPLMGPAVKMYGIWIRINSQARSCFDDTSNKKAQILKIQDSSRKTYPSLAKDKEEGGKNPKTTVDDPKKDGSGSVSYLKSETNQEVTAIMEQGGRHMKAEATVPKDYRAREC
ncbi:hypothetical protein PanWU01x14_077990 [Parasponia andersonii]|uniref:Uncharacterized protein n=1 Tax=Parasponia andersonii TaxID=3476 RepID=A0A2P5DBU9_PARAD|nr:hypothetical protein PanWU01x14_077990 [Parasponia andersonii]